MLSRVPRYFPVLTRRRFARAAFLAAVVGATERAEAQTFVQLTELGTNLGPRITKTVANQKLGVDLFGEIGTKVTFIDHGIPYQFASDPSWGRVLSGRLDYWINEFTNASGPGGRLKRPLGVDISARKRFYVADRSRGHLVIAWFDAAAMNLVTPIAWTTAESPRPVDVAWDGRATPLSSDFVYVLDDSLSRVSYWDANASSSIMFVWRYGSVGSGAGQFLRPSGVCAGKTVSSTGGTQFNTYFYVVDRGNRRVAWLERISGGATWIREFALAQWDPTDCTVDHFGNLYVTDESSHRIHKFTRDLVLLATYGTYGKGAVLNTLAFPRAISVPCGLKVVNSQSVWYCEGRVITAEAWTSGSGAVEHYLGIEGSITGGPDTSGGRATFSYRVTDHAYHTIRLVRDATSQVYLEWWRGLMPPGQHTWFWSGSETDPEGYYHFEVASTSAYGCNSQPWCARGWISGSFWHAGSPPPPPPDCDPNCTSPPAADEAVPTTLFLRQHVVTEPRPLARVSGWTAAAESAPASAGQPGALSAVVREFGVRGLMFSVTRPMSSSTVMIRVHSMSGRPVRRLVNETLAPGVYEIGWDGLDDRGNRAAPGVYIAVLTAGSHRAAQRLILRHP